MHKILLFIICVIAHDLLNAQTYTQTRTGSRLYMSRPQYWPNATWQKVQYDDNVYMSSSKILLSSTYFSSLDQFNFSLPSNAVIQSIIVKLRRFKTGRSNVVDRMLSLLWPGPDGTYSVGNAPNLAKPTYWPETEAEAIYTFSPSGTGSDGQPYNITVPQVNSPWFGFVFEFGCTKGGSGAVLNIDQATMTVSYTLSSTVSNLRITQFDDRVLVTASEKGIYNLSVRNITGQLLQTATLNDPSDRTVYFNNKCKGLCIITVEGRDSRKTIKAFVR